MGVVGVLQRLEQWAD